ELPIGPLGRMIELDRQGPIDGRALEPADLLGDQLGATWPSSRTRTVLGCACARSDTLAALGPKVRLAGFREDHEAPARVQEDPARREAGTDDSLVGGQQQLGGPGVGDRRPRA